MSVLYRRDRHPARSPRRHGQIYAQMVLDVRETGFKYSAGMTHFKYSNTNTSNTTT